MSNGLRDSWISGYYGGAGIGSSDAGTSGDALSSVGASLGFNVGHETFRVQAAITGLVIVAFVGLILLHRAGHRFSVHVA